MKQRELERHRYPTLSHTEYSFNVLHKTSSGIGSSTLSTAKNLINCTALTYTT